MKKYFLLVLLSSSFELLFAQWNVVGNALTQNSTWPLLSIAGDQLGNMYTVGTHSVNPIKSYVAKWNGMTWDTLGDLRTNYQSRFLNCVHVDKWNTVYASNVTNSLGNYELVKFNGSTWAVVGGTNSLQANQTIGSIASDTLGDIFVAGDFTNTGGQRYVAKWNGSVWTELTGLGGWVQNNPSINDVCADKSGNVYAVGNFTNAAGQFYVAKWNGTSWAQLGGANNLNLTRAISNVFCDKFNNVYAVSCYNVSNDYYYIAKWNGSTWSELGDISPYTKSLSLQTACIDARGNIYAATGLSSSLNKFTVLKWDGIKWSPMEGANACPQLKGAQALNILSLAVDNLDNLYAVGGMADANCNFIVMKYEQPYLLGLSANSSELLELTVSPNPANTTIALQARTNETFNLELANSMGQIVLSRDGIFANEAIDVSHLSTGIYVLNIQSKGLRKTIKIVKE